MYKIFTSLAALALIAGLSACGQTKSDRALSGAGLGAAGGAAIGAMTGSPLTGALIGGAAGAAGGALTDPEDVDLGRPLWRR